MVNMNAMHRFIVVKDTAWPVKSENSLELGK